MLIIILVIVLFSVNLKGQVLTPPYFNLAAGRRITASATCGEDINERELYCKLVGANADADANINLIQGQVCDYCIPGNHPASFAIDGSERWWQSPPLSRGTKYNEVNLTIDLGQEFHVAYVTITMANSPRPGVWVLERSRDNGQTYIPWQYFADSPTECQSNFGRGAPLPTHAIRDDTVICDTQYSRVVPLEGGEIFIPLVKNRPSALDFFGSEVLQEWTRATNIRLRLLRTKTLLGHLMSVARQDPTVTRRYFYSIKDISIGGRCRCNGHADTCDITDPDDRYRLLCRCQHNTCGDQCERCCDNFVQKSWRLSTLKAPFTCEPCNCFGHSETCIYDQSVDMNGTSIDINGRYDGGGVCTNCRDNTQGTNCNQCKSGYFRPFGKEWNETDVCERCQCDYFYSTGNCTEFTGKCECRENYQPPDCNVCSLGFYDYPTCKPCDCNINGTRGGVCHADGGQCPCKYNYRGLSCQECAPNYYNFPDCLPCDCNSQGTRPNGVCDPKTGQCDCESKYGSRQCSECEDGNYDFPECKFCSCDPRGTTPEVCEKEFGRCLCREGYGGLRCDECKPGYYNYPECIPCNCSTIGSQNPICDPSGKCVCLENFSSRACDQCKVGFYQFPECSSCNCTGEGSMGSGCDDAGRCHCKSNFDEIKCTKCKEGYYNFPLCEECNCDPSGVAESFRGCKDANDGELCKCKDRVQGRICNECKPLFWNLKYYNPVGCEECDCHIPGILGGVKVCDGKSGQCPCKMNVVSQKCDECEDGYFNLTSSNILGCTECGCDVGGSVHGICEKATGKCFCRPRVTGKTCTKPQHIYYFPTVYQFQYEAEDGISKTGGPVRFGYDENLYPGYSWRGYAVYNELQPETRHDVNIDKSSLYRVVLHYVNPTDEPIIGEIIATPENQNDVEQKSKVKFESNSNLVTVSTGSIPSTFYFNPGRWQFQIKINQYMMVDYFVLLPAAYYEGSILQKRITLPCMLNISNVEEDGRISSYPNPCMKLQYPSLDGFDSVKNDKSFIKKNGDDRSPPKKFFTDTRVLGELNLEDSELVVLSSDQPKIGYNFDVAKNGRYVLLVSYFTPSGENQTEIEFKTTSEKGRATGRAVLSKCLHTTICRQIATTKEGEAAIFPLTQTGTTLELDGNLGEDDLIAINSITAIPLRRWVLDYIRPKEFCVMKDGSCLIGTFTIPPDSIKIEAETDNSNRVIEDSKMPPGVTGFKLVRLDPNDRTVEIGGKVPSPGYYKILVHYYQPESPDFHAEVVVSSPQDSEARVKILHCPSIAGCRSVVTQDDRNSRFYIEREFSITLKSLKNVSIDYIVLVPPPHENEQEISKYLKKSPLDETRKFIAECGKNHMYLPSDTEGFCRDAVFSLTTDYNNGALYCDCVTQGSLDFECGEFGGQCLCKENIIGRRCERCKTGFYGFPDCKPCQCPSTAYCEPTTGQCICPPRVVDDDVTGTKCSKCAPQSFGYHPLIGCEECGCSQIGSEAGNSQCDLLTGKCPCRENVVGQRCDKCRAGYWAFPYCQICHCDIRGTTDEVCNQDTASCTCKKLVDGRGCDSCKYGSFNLQETNPVGCTKCFCFGKAQRCFSGSLFWANLTIPEKDWSAVSIDPFVESTTQIIGYFLEYEQRDASPSDHTNTEWIPVSIPFETGPIPGNHSHVLYFKGSLSGNYIASYGGLLKYTLLSNPGDSRNDEILFGPDVIIEGEDLPPRSDRSIRLMHSALDQLDGDNKMNMNISLLEKNFVVATGTTDLLPATRDQLMVALRGLKAIYIRAAYWANTLAPKLEEFNLEIGKEQNNIEENRALPVERCDCPSNYKGLSCEECSEGYFRSSQGPFGGYCVECQCHGHSTSCDPVSGVCFNCTHHTTGDHCENCDVGYHGDATRGSPGDCLICACPLPFPSNNFATSCEFTPDHREISCTCRPEYYGPRCESCAPGFFGRPEERGQYCRPCQCSGNININDPSSCDSVTGACLKCMNNTGGPACNLCAPGFYGDALITKDCRSCSCDKCGTSDCDSFSGDCKCLPNVEGVNCDRCKPDHFGLSSCERRGCVHCDCGIASVTSQCDDATGQCLCKPGTTGLRCERCAPGFWNYTSDGCQPCLCNREFAVGVGCNSETGQCECLREVQGANCSHCKHRWVLIKDWGCKSCDPCQFQLLDDTDKMAFVIDPVKKEFDEVAVSYFTTQRLLYFNETAENLEPTVNLLNPSRENLNPFYTALASLETDSKTQRQKAETTNESLKDKAQSSLRLKQKSEEVEKRVQEIVGKTRLAVSQTKEIMEGLVGGEKQSSPQTDASLAEAKATIELMKKVSFNGTEALTENSTVVDRMNQVKEFIKPVEESTKELKMKADEIIGIRENLRDLRNESDYSLTTSYKSNEIAAKIRDPKFPSRISLLTITHLEGLIPEITTKSINSSSMNEETTEKLEELKKSYQDLQGISTSVKDSKVPLEQTTETLKNELENNKDTIRKSNAHVNDLKYQADRLDQDFERSRQASGRAVDAATANKKITDALNEAYENTQKTIKNSDSATKMSSGIGESAAKAMEPSRNLLRTSKSSTSQVENDLKRPLEDSKVKIGDIKGLSQETKSKLGMIVDEINKIKKINDNTDLENSVQISGTASNNAQNAVENVEEILKKIPEDESNAKSLPIIVSDLNKGVQVAENQLNEAKESVPLSSVIIESLEGKKPDFDEKKTKIGSDIGDLKARIQTARELANRVSVGMNFVASSNLLVGNPQTLETQQVQTKISVFFKTADPNGLILFLGNEPGKKPDNDFMAIEIKGGYPVLTVDLGSGPQVYMLQEKYVGDDRWYKATVERSGRSIQFTITEEIEGREIPYVKTVSYSLGTKSLFNVDPNATKLYVGGFPAGQFANPVKPSSFRGSIEDLTIGEEKVGLWNFRDAQNVSPAVGRDTLVDLSRKQGLRFLGNGYAVLDRTQFPFLYRSAISFRFQTTAKNGLMFLVGKGRKFMSIEIVNGYVKFQFNLGSTTGSLASGDKFNDGRWHTISAVRDGSKGQLVVDGLNRGLNSSGDGVLDVSDYMYFGGYPSQHSFPEVTNKDFEGCLDEVMIEADSVDLRKAVDTRDTMAGCPTSQVDLVASFFGDGYIKVDVGDPPVEGPTVSLPKDDIFELNFRFRSNDSDGLIFYGADAVQENYLSVSMSGGALHVRTNPGTSKVNTDALNDGNWHVVTVTRDKSKLFVNVDDTSEYEQKAPEGPLSLSSPGSIYLFGGRPTDYNMVVDAAESESPYKGCLGDININGKRIDFTASDGFGSSVTQNCQSDKEVPDALNSFSIPKSEDDVEESQSRPPVSQPQEATTPSPTPTPKPIRPSKKEEYPSPTPFEKCRLPFRRQIPLDDDGSLDVGVQFGNFDKTSRIEYIEPKDDGSRSEYSIEFRTLYPHGIILMKTHVDSNDFLAVYLKGGSIHFGFDSGAGVGLINTSTIYNDGQWHTVMVERVLAEGTLTVDGALIGRGNSAGTTTSINTGPPLFIGGLSTAVWARKYNTGKKIGNIDQPFKGCLRNLNIRKQHPGEPSLKYGIEQCSESTEPGFAFYPNAGFMKLSDRFKVGRKIKIEVDIKPRSLSGIILAVHGLKDYMVLQLVNGTVRFTLDNGKAPLTSSFSTQPYALCDGRWHSIAVTKMKNVVTLAVDQAYASPAIGPGGLDATNTDHPLYWGGHPNPHNKPGLETSEQFVGCMRNLHIQTKEPLKFTYEAVQGKVGLHTCETD